MNALLAFTPPIKVIGISSAPEANADLSAIAAATGAVAPAGGVDCDGDGIIDIPAGQPLVCSLAFAGNVGQVITALVGAASITPVAVDIKPGSSPNVVNVGARGVIPVAILTTDLFDAATVNPLSVRFGPHSAQDAHGFGHLEDVSGDGRQDLVLHFRTQDTVIVCGQTAVSLTGQTLDGHPISGSDAIETVGCK